MDAIWVHAPDQALFIERPGHRALRPRYWRERLAGRLPVRRPRGAPWVGRELRAAKGNLFLDRPDLVAVFVDLAEVQAAYVVLDFAAAATVAPYR